MKIKMPMPLIRWTQLEAYTYFVLGTIVSKDGTEGSDQEALVHLGKSLELSRVINFSRGMASEEYSISLVKSKLERDIRNNEDQLKKLQNIDDLNVRDYGEENELTITSGLSLAIAPWKANRGVEAERLSEGGRFERKNSRPATQYHQTHQVVAQKDQCSPSQECRVETFVILMVSFLCGEAWMLQYHLWVSQYVASKALAKCVNAG
jgi:hypothetical protein